MRKLLLSLTVLAFTVGLTIGAPVRFVKYDEKTKTLTVKTGKKGDEKEVEYKLSSKVKFTDDMDEEIPFDKAVEKLSDEKKAPKYFDLKTKKDDDEKVESIKFTKGKGGKKGGDKGEKKEDKPGVK